MFVEVIGEVVYRGELYRDERILSLIQIGMKPKMLYGIDWKFSNTNIFEEQYLSGAKGYGHVIDCNRTFIGRMALPEFLAWAKIDLHLTETA